MWNATYLRPHTFGSTRNRDLSGSGQPNWVGRFRACVVALFILSSSAFAENQHTYKIGVYYWPGWKDGPRRPAPWDKIRTFPERRPLLGWYKEGEQDVMDQQLKWMKKYGLSFVVFSHVHDAAGRPDLPHAAQAFLNSPERHGIAFAVQWANHTPLPRTEWQFYETVKYVIGAYFNKPEYLKIDGRPAFFIFSGIWLENNARKYNLDVAEMIKQAQSMAREAGLPGIYFIGGEAVDSKWVRLLNDQGYGAISAYNYPNPPRKLGRRYSHSYEELDAGYRENWTMVATASPNGFIVPMTVGWDRRAWGGTKNDPLHDNCGSSIESFRAHVEAAKSFIDDHWPVTKGFGVICCWNEYGEGSYIEPTETQGFDRLQTIQEVFKLHAD